jgi:histidyl-tRNA synthetase
MRDKISTQMEFANKKGFQYIIIMGHKEALEDRIIVRNIKTFEQEIIPLDKLAKYLIKLEKKIK